jgi:alcohol dehydrogenase
MVDDDARAPVPMDLVVARELEIVGSHGMQAYRYDAMLEMIRQGKLAPQRLITRTIALAEAPHALMSMGDFQHSGVTVIDRL